MKVWTGDCLEVLPTLPSVSVQACITSPPYFGLRDYGCDGQVGMEPTPEEYVAKMVEVFREVRRVLRDDGTLWLNLGDSYSRGDRRSVPPQRGAAASSKDEAKYCFDSTAAMMGDHPTIKPKDLIGIPWRVAFALQADGWYLRQDIIWHKPNPMPESVTDRCTKAHEYLFLLSKSQRYYYDADAIREPSITPADGRGSTEERKMMGHPSRYGNTSGMASRGEGFSMPSIAPPEGGRNKRSVWTVTMQPFKGAHFAVFPEALIEPCVMAGCPEGGTVLDPFAGSGTTGIVAKRNGCDFIGVELNPDYAEMARKRVANENPVLWTQGAT